MAPGAYSIYDAFTGPTHGLNSGEIPLNMLINLLPVATTAIGGGIASKVSPAAQLIATGDLMEAMKGVGAPLDPRVEHGAKVQQGAILADLLEKETARMAGRKGAEGVSQADAMRSLRQRGTRNLLLGGLGGALAGGIPAIMMMRDQPEGV